MRKLKYDYVVGTGGIGSGILFRFSDNITLGRNESRLAELMDVRDFCKLRITLHYVITYLIKVYLSMQSAESGMTSAAERSWD